MRKLNERGAVAAEFALLLPVLLTILFGIIEFGMIMYGREVVTNATREGARAGITQGPPKMTTGAITTISNNYLLNTGINPAHRNLYRRWGRRGESCDPDRDCAISVFFSDSVDPYYCWHSQPSNN